ncbi:DUF302 domain-containing protein [Reichenbachiella versicolor]|uniref:DUF302 domain-containing protein n=1 Tax=Reichenbachiella versicolor TaxID=1821036 RepID=UPI000D6E0BD1|nr:DUF302 domain-containing protein [Reichenbachiella versicolor]
MSINSSLYFFKFLLIIFFQIVLSLETRSQDASVYISNRPLDETVTNILFHIDRYDFTYLNTFAQRADYNDSSVFKGKVQIINFEDKGLFKLIACEPSIALEFPLRVVIWEEVGDVFVSYINPISFKRRFHIQGCDQILFDLNRRLMRLVNESIKRQKK